MRRYPISAVVAARASNVLQYRLPIMLSYLYKH